MTTTSLRAARLFSLLEMGSVGFLHPFITLFYRQHELSGREIGLLVTVGSLAGVLAAPVWGNFSDRARDGRRLLQLAMVGTLLSTLWLGRQSQFAWMALMVGLMGFFGACITPLVDTMVVGLTQGNIQGGYGSVRLWGSVGWVIAAPLSGWIIERAGIGSAFVGYGVVMAAGIVVLSVIQLKGREEEKHEDRKAQRSTKESWWNLVSLSLRGKFSSGRAIMGSVLSGRARVGLLITLVIIWLTRSGTFEFEAIYLKQLGAGESVIGLANAVGALVELPGMLLADRLVRRFGAAAVFQWSLVLSGIGMLIVLLAPAVVPLFVQRVFGGFGFSFYTVAVVLLVSEGAAAERRATMMALYMVTIFGLVQMAAGPLAGWVFDTAGAYWLYGLSLGGYVVGWLILQVTNPAGRLRHNSYSDIGVEGR